MTRCSYCPKGLNPSYIRVGAKESFKKVGLAQLENLFFQLNNYENDDQILDTKHVTADTDELILEALIYLNKKYIL